MAAEPVDAMMVAPISIPGAIEELILSIMQIRRKTNTLIDYYIYPDPTPNEIDAYEPRLRAIEMRLESWSKLSYTKLAHLIVDSDTLAASYLKNIVEEMLNAVHGIQELFINHYDRNLDGDRKPYYVIYATLDYREKQLQRVMDMQMTDNHRMKPEDLRANAVGYFCRGAIQVLNGRDRGKISPVDRSELMEENRDRLKKFGGGYIWWHCHECAFKLRYHVTNSSNSSINSTDEIRDHPGVGVEYRSLFLVKCHLFQPQSSTNSKHLKYGCLFCFAYGKSLQPGESIFATGRELATHIDKEHKRPVPQPILLQEFKVAISGQVARRVNRWDINFK